MCDEGRWKKIFLLNLTHTRAFGNVYDEYLICNLKTERCYQIKLLTTLGVKEGGRKGKRHLSCMYEVQQVPANTLRSADKPFWVGLGREES